MLKELKIADIQVGQRHRRDMGDLTTLAHSIRQEGLLQPVGVTDRLELVFGERRLLACRDILKRKTILARVVDVSSILAGEYAENEIRKGFTPSERVAIARAIERRVGNRRGQRTDRLRGKIPEVAPGQRTREAAAEKAGFPSPQLLSWPTPTPTSRTASSTWTRRPSCKRPGRSSSGRPSGGHRTRRPRRPSRRPARSGNACKRPGSSTATVAGN